MRNKSKPLVPGSNLRALMGLYRLHGNAGADVVGRLLNRKAATVQMWLSRGLSADTYELLEFKLEKYRREGYPGAQ